MYGWSTQQLTEFLAAASAARSRSALLQLTVERGAEAVEAEVAAVLVGRRVAAQVGFPRARVPRAWLGQLSVTADDIDIPGLGPGQVAAGRVEGEPDTWFVVARLGAHPFRSEERALLRGMARILSLSLHNLVLLSEERRARRASQRQAREILRRQRLLEALGGVQRMIVARASQQEILERLVAETHTFVGDPIVGARLLEADGSLRIVAAHGLDRATLEAVVHHEVGTGASGMAVAEDRLVVIEGYPEHPAAVAALAANGLQAAAAAPIRREGQPVGSLVVASDRPGRRYRPDELQALTAFAEHASLALTDAARTRQMLHSAVHDGLTGLPNRTLFLDRLEQRLVTGRRAQPATAVLFMDLDGLKRVNDTLGHAAGDRVLIEVARRLTGSVRDEDTVARLSGDEFTVLLDAVESEGAAVAAAERLLVALRAPFMIEGRPVSLSASIGLRLARPGRDHADEALRCADLAMYEAKARGGGGVAAFHAGLDARAARRFELEADLRRGLERSEFRLVYQPIVGLPDGRVRGVEALLRWDRGIGELVPPAEFIPLAEESGIIVELGAWVLAEACRAALRLDPRPDGLGVSVNLSARQLLDASLDATVEEVLAESGLPPERLTLEITESVFLADAATTIERVDALRRRGVRVAIDDFGTGYSSLSYLRRLPLDAVKIDRAFIEHLADDTRQRALARAIVELCRSLALETVAEGIETRAQARCLVELGCERAQGYLFGRPVAERDIAARLHDSRPPGAGPRLVVGSSRRSVAGAGHRTA